MQTSDKHGPRLADDLNKDTRAGHEEFREMEPEVHRVDLIEDEDGVIDELEAEQRAELARYLRPSLFPARPAELLAAAEEAFAPDEVLARLRALPDRQYATVQEVWAATGGDVESRRA
jgi:hypothetical protein